MPVIARPMISFWICEVPSYRVRAARVAEIALDGVVVHVSGSAMDLDREVRALEGRLGRVKLRDRGPSLFGRPRSLRNPARHASMREASVLRTMSAIIACTTGSSRSGVRIVRAPWRT